MTHPELDARPRRLLALAGLLQTYRASKRWSVEQAALHAGIGHMTWRRAEQGIGSRTKTYASMDELFGLPAGTVNHATNNDELMADLAGRLGVAVHTTPAGRMPKQQPARLIPSWDTSPKSDAAAIADVLDRLKAWGSSAANDAAVKSLLAALTSHLTTPKETP